MKRALLIGINYFGTSSELRGCLNDVDDMAELLEETFGYESRNIVVMKDSSDDPKHEASSSPTRKNIIDEMVKIVSQSKAGDTIFIHYSGHGTWTYDYSDDEKDGRDELICPVDDKYISDDEIQNILVDPLEQGVTLRCVFDCCHSGTMMDLPFRWRYSWTLHQLQRSRLLRM